MATILAVKILDDGRVIGQRTAEEFRAFFGIKNGFLQDLIQRYNLDQIRNGSSIRAELVIIKDDKVLKLQHQVAF